MCADSAHKTLPVLTGGAYLHIAEGEENAFPDVKDVLSLFSSTSPSYLTLASLDLANRTLADGYDKRLARISSRIQETKARLKDAGFTVLPSEPLKITVEDGNVVALAEKTRKAGIEHELCDESHLVFMASAENDPHDFELLEEALLPLGSLAAPPSPPPKPRLGVPAMSIREALFANKERVCVQDAVGRVYAEIAASCPPAVPIAVCGERIDEETVKAFLYYDIQEVSVVKAEK